MQLAHRISWELHYGPIPAGDGYHGTCVLHTCDNRPCIRPDHLFLGTQAENLADMARKGRGGERPLRGEDHGAAKLTWLEVAEIRALAGTMLQREIAARFGVSRPRISQIINGKTWHMTP